MLRSAILAGALVATSSCCCLISLPELGSTPAPPPPPSAPGEQKPQPKVLCPMEWVSPTTFSDAGDMPPTGMVPFDWTDHPTASGYDMTLITPNGSPIEYDVDGSEKNLFLENYSQEGNYQLVVTALDANGQPLCSITMNFNIPVASGDGTEKADEGGGGDEDSNPSSIIPSNPVVPSNPIPPVILVPTEDVPK